MNGSLPIDEDLAAFEPSESFRVGFAFLLEDECSELFWCAEVGDFDSALQNHGTVVIFVIGEVHGAAAHFHSSGDCSFVDVVAVHSMAAEGRYERRVDVEYTEEEVFGDMQKAEEASECDDIAAGATEEFEDGRTEWFDAAEIPWSNNVHWQASRLRAFNPTTTRLAGNHLDDFCVELPCAYVFEKIEECGSAAADEDCESKWSVGDGRKGQLKWQSSRFGGRHSEGLRRSYR